MANDVMTKDRLYSIVRSYTESDWQTSNIIAAIDEYDSYVKKTMIKKTLNVLNNQLEFMDEDTIPGYMRDGILQEIMLKEEK